MVTGVASGELRTVYGVKPGGVFQCSHGNGPPVESAVVASAVVARPARRSQCNCGMCGQSFVVLWLFCIVWRYHFTCSSCLSGSSCDTERQPQRLGGWGLGLVLHSSLMSLMMELAGGGVG